MTTRRWLRWLKNLVAALAVFYFGPACTAPIPGPPPGLNTVLNGMEYFGESSALARLGTRLGEYFTNTNLAFGQADAIAFNWIPTDVNMSGGFWPDVDDPYFGTQNRQAYIDFARNRRNANPNATYPFGTFFIGGPSMANFDCGQPHTLGISGWTGLPNDVSADPKDRFTYIFIDRVETLLGFNCFPEPGSVFNYPRDNVYVHLITHEIGHQRAGLTHRDDPAHPEYQNLYHRGDVPSATSDRRDVMLRNIYSTDLAYRFAIFDQFDLGPYASSETCANNLHRHRNIPG